MIVFDAPGPREQLKRRTTKRDNEALTPARVSEAERQWHEAQPQAPMPVVIHHPVDEELQTGDSRALGGAMEIKAPWRRD